MNKEEMYTKFRYELDEYAVPLIVNNMDYIDLIYEDKEKGFTTVGFACLYNNYLDAFYILPEYRKKGIGSEMVQKLYDTYKFKSLHIINSNIPAVNFWNKNFKLKKLEINFCDTLYEIMGKVNANE